MTDEERQKLCESLRLAFSPCPCRIAADEIERLAKELHISNKALSMCSDECNRSYELAERSDARYQEKIERLAEENRKLKISLDYAWRRIEAETGDAGMTDEERQKLCDTLRAGIAEQYGHPIGNRAADEIERLAEAVKYWNGAAEYAHKQFAEYAHKQLVDNNLRPTLINNEQPSKGQGYD